MVNYQSKRKEMSKIKAIIISIGAGILAIWYTYTKGKKQGEENATNKQNQKTLESVQKANNAVDRVNNDSSFRSKLYDKYKRG
jgi:membrane protein DedA with SNARE-associated domain